MRTVTTPSAWRAWFRGSALAASISLAWCPAEAAEWSLVCQNPGREYNITYNYGDAVAIVDPDSSASRQPVLATINSDAMRVIVLQLAQPGMASLLHLRPYLKNEIYADGQLVQTDGCHLNGQ